MNFSRLCLRGLSRRFLPYFSPLLFVIVANMFPLSICAEDYFPYRLKVTIAHAEQQTFFSPDGTVRADFIPSAPWIQPPHCGVATQSLSGSVAVGETLSGMAYLGGACDAYGAIVACEENGRFVLLRQGLSGRLLSRITLPVPPAAVRFHLISRYVSLALVASRLLVVKSYDSSLKADISDAGETVAATSDFLSKTGAYLTRGASSAFLHFLDSSGKETAVFRLPRYDSYSISLRGTTAGVIAANNADIASFCYTIQAGKGITETGMIDAKPELAAILFGNRPLVAAIRPSDKGYALFTRSIATNSAAYSKTYAIPDGFVEPTSIIADSLAILVFGNGIALASTDGEILAAERFEDGIKINGLVSAQIAGGILALRRGAATTLFNIEPESYYLLKRFGTASGIGAAFGLAGLFMLITYRRYRIVRRALNATLEHGGTRVVFLLNTAGRLKRTNRAGRNLLGVTGDVPLGRPFGYYCVGSELKPVGEFVEKAFSRQLPAQEHIALQNEPPREFIMSAAPLRSSLAQFRGMIITGLDITEELEKKRLVNWAQLAHDMQTNLSIIRLNAERLTNDGDKANDDRRRKILHQSAIILQRVRDIVTVGRNDDMQIGSFDAEELCREVMAEFDETMFPNAVLKLDVRSCRLECDARKLIRALRNMVENGIKSLKNKQGEVVLSCRTDDLYIRFSVHDTGVGMSPEARANILKPYYTTAYQEGGSGIGTMIIQKSVDLHRGRIEIHSEEGRGTVFSLIIPRKYDRQRQDK